MHALIALRKKYHHHNTAWTFAIAALTVLAPALRAEETSYPPKVSLDEVQQRIKDCPKTHPRLLATRETLEKLAESVKQDPLQKLLAESIVKQAEKLLTTPPVEYKLEGMRLLSMANECQSRVILLATAFHLTHDARFAQRAKQEMLTAARFSDWNPKHFLDVAGFSAGFAIGYDWLYDQLDDASRREIRTALVEKSLKLAFDSKHDSWVKRKNNWGQVCHGGLTLAALAILEDEPELAAKTVYNALENITHAMNAYAPHGSYPEGPGYWAYGTSNNVVLIAGLETALGSDFGLSKAPGFDETGAFPILASGPSGLYFNYSDGGAERVPDATHFWFAARYHHADWLLGERELWQKSLKGSRAASFVGRLRYLPLALLWMNGAVDTPAQLEKIGLPLAWSSGGDAPIALFRSSWTDPHATFVGVKAGSPSGNHGHMDIGSFVLDSDGIRWATDLGAEGYYGIESRGMSLWKRDQESDRWTIFRLNNLGHNTLAIDGQLQQAAASAAITHFSDDPEHSHAVVDMSSIYDGQAGSVQRGVALLPSREVVIQDELSGLRPGSHVRWGMITPGTPDGLGKKELNLHQGDAQLKLTIATPGKLNWKQLETERPRHEWDSPNPGTRMVAFEAIAPKSGKLTIVVVATPGSVTNATAAKAPIVALKDWSN